jgi:hypothetical protein
MATLARAGGKYVQRRPGEPTALQVPGRGQGLERVAVDPQLELGKARLDGGMDMVGYQLSDQVSERVERVLQPDRQAEQRLIPRGAREQRVGRHAEAERAEQAAVKIDGQAAWRCESGLDPAGPGARGPVAVLHQYSD